MPASTASAPGWQSVSVSGASPGQFGGRHAGDVQGRLYSRSARSVHAFRPHALYPVGYRADCFHCRAALIAVVSTWPRRAALATGVLEEIDQPVEVGDLCQLRARYLYFELARHD